ncbi:hypothetical protein F5B19DRAFT_461525 [Rostrohypoxylon terebratum]|nr:hypothetical protein F5B19DRAFT_461525 [Rostrohypoxylon terebratum]
MSASPAPLYGTAAGAMIADTALSSRSLGIWDWVLEAQASTPVATKMAKRGGHVDTDSGLKSVDQSRRKRPARLLQLNPANFSTGQPTQGQTDHPKNPPTRLPIHSFFTATMCRAFNPISNSALPCIPTINPAHSIPINHVGDVFGTLPFISSPTPPPLFTMLTKSMCRALDSKSRSFLPNNNLNILTPTLVKEELKRTLPTLPESVLDNYTTRIFAERGADHGCPRSSALTTYLGLPDYENTRLIKTFVILVLLDKVASIQSFIFGGFTDSLLPIHHSPFSDEKTWMYPLHPKLSFWRCFDNWPSASIEMFLETQWIVLSPFLGNVERDVPLYKFSAETILPVFDNDSTTEPAVQTGGHSIVRRVRIHSWHHNFRQGQNESYFALKKLHSPHIKDFRREVVALRRFVISPNVHIIKLLAAFQHGTSFYLLFPWAEGGNLRAFWKDNPNPVINTSFLTWIVEQCLGIATALHQIHHGYHTEATGAGNSNSPTDISSYGLHGDIKPANILLFEDGAHSENPIWVLSDFGLSGLHHKANCEGSNRPKGFSPTYRAPELDTRSNVGSSYDIWSLGCVLLETTVWLLRGWDGVGSFALSRVATGKPAKQAGWIDDKFFELVPQQSLGAPKAVLKPSVDQCFEHLVGSQSASACVVDFLNLIRDDLLDVDWQTRASSSFLSEKLQCLRQKCLEDPVYTVALPRPRKPPWSYEESASLTDNNLAFNYEVQPIQVNMAQIPTLNGLDMYWSNFGENPYDTHQNTDISHDAPISRMVLSDILPNGMQQDAFLSQSMPILNQQSPSEALFTAPSGRRRTLDNMTGPIDMGDQRKKKARKKKEPLTRDALIDQSSSITSRDSSQTTAKGSTELMNTSKDKRYFACPFYKRNPTRYNTKTWKACIGPGWDISRLKEHIYRNHSSRCYRCTRCLSEFQSDSDLHEHSRLDPPCPKRDSDVDFDTIDATQKNRIRSKDRGLSDEKKWDNIYRIIFKLNPTAKIPSPYYDTIADGVDEAATVEKIKDPGSLAAFETYLHDCLAHDNNGQDASAIQSCLNLVQRFQEGHTYYQPRSTIDMPSLTFDYPDDATRASESQDLPSLTTADDVTTVPEPEALNDTAYWDSSFEARFNEVFSSGKSFDFSDSLNLGCDGEVYPGG